MAKEANATPFSKYFYTKGQMQLLRHAVDTMSNDLLMFNQKPLLAYSLNVKKGFNLSK